ncbi:DUF2335 domain-containing protein [Dickeya oryzae]
MLKEYDDIVPNGAERIMAKSEREQAHRHRLTEKGLDGEISRDKRGQWMAFTITMTILRSRLFLPGRAKWCLPVR